MKKTVVSKLGVVLLASFALQACKMVPTFLEGSFQEVPIYKRGNLAKLEMGWNPDPMEAALKNHIYFAKEASSGGAEAAGGGCGCN